MLVHYFFGLLPNFYLSIYSVHTHCGRALSVAMATVMPEDAAPPDDATFLLF